MSHAARADLESLLQHHRLDHTLTSVQRPAPVVEPLATGLPDLDRALDGGLPRGQLSELVGPVSSGRTSLLVRLIASATAQGELAALVDSLDRFDPPSAAAAGVTLDQLLWIRGHLMSHPGFARDLNQRALTQALEACALVLQSGGFALVALDLGGVPASVLRRVPFTTWRRLQRMVEGSRTACVLVSELPLARSTAGLTIKMQPAGAPRKEPHAESSRGGAGPCAGPIRPEPHAESSRVGAGPCAGPMGRWLKNPNADPASGCARLFEGLTIDVQAVHARTRWAEGGGCVVETEAN
jgi:hypothetical protein